MDIFTVRLLFEYISKAQEYFFFLSSTIVRLARRRGGSSKRLDTDSYSRLRVFAYATGERLVGTVLEGVRRRVDGKRNAFSGRQWWPFVTRGNVFIPWKYRFTTQRE